MGSREQQPIEVGRMIGFCVVNRNIPETSEIEFICGCGKKFKKLKFHMYNKSLNCGCQYKEIRAGRRIRIGKVTCINCRHDTTEIEKRSGHFCKKEDAGYNEKGECDSWAITTLQGALSCPYEDGMTTKCSTGKVQRHK